VASKGRRGAVKTHMHRDMAVVVGGGADKGCFGSYMKPYNLILLSMILQLE